MANILATAPATGNCVLWTPWGPQLTATADPKFTSLHKTLKIITKRKARQAARLDDAYSSKPECSYEP